LGNPEGRGKNARVEVKIRSDDAAKNAVFFGGNYLGGGQKSWSGWVQRCWSHKIVAMAAS